ncbi:hypothetical protein [Halomonas daqiaonensis]|uniref:Uncharacterized protein n=1 Tax=Halomonas daqiaonensis TaxID=650850 RepID=A0A1H7M3A7_9GAMM|nr:hypothetical protein [Halomonas daqiaonensis]SEL05077.1 hypothetical protein SAMN04488129_106113 [Halomonas daqiaonensis]
MQLTTIIQRQQAGHRAEAAMRGADGSRLLSEGSLKLKYVVTLGLLTACLAATQLVQASDATTAGGGSAEEVFGVTRMHLTESLDDTALETIRGRYVDVRMLGEGGEDSVILWDERPGRGTGNDGNGTGRSLSTGLGNQQSTTVTTRRGQ